MMRIGTWLAAVIFILVASHSRAQEPPDKQLDFVRKLRDKGYHDLALEYLERLNKQAGPALKKFLPMEMARTRVALARTKEPEQRLGLFKAARAELSAFVKANPTGPEGVQARLDLARLVTLEGKAILAKALRQETLKAQQDEAFVAEKHFIQAGVELDVAIKQLADLAANYKNSDSEQEKLVRQQAEEEKINAGLERGLNLLDQAKTYIDKENADLGRKRAEIVDAARKAFKSLAAIDDQNPTCLLAAAWMIRGAQEAQDYVAADNVYNTLMSLKQKAADPAKRWARYFQIKTILEYPDFKLPSGKKPKALEKWQLIQKEALAWLSANAAYKNSPEGQAMRYELGHAYYQEAMLLSDKKKGPSPKATAKLNLAQQYLAALADSESDVAEDANQLNLGISFARMGAGTPVNALTNFDDCFIKGHYELFQLKKLGAKDEEERKAHLKTAIAAFLRALKLADSKTPATKKGEARFFLATAYMLSGDPYRTAVAGEALARTLPPSKRAVAAAGYALEAYAGILSRDNNESNRQHLVNLANFILDNKAWENELITPATHYQVAMALLRDGNLKDAIGHLEKISSNFPGFIYSQGQLVFIALEAKKQANDDAARKFFQDKVLQAIGRMPTLPANIDSTSAAMYLSARAKYSDWLYSEGIQNLNTGNVAGASAKFREMLAYNKQLSVQLAKLPVKLTDKTRKEIAFTLGFLDKLGKLGLAETEFKAGNYDKVLSPELAGSVVAEVKKLGAAAGPIRMADYEVTGEVLGLALRANVQKGNVNDAREILSLVTRLSGTEGELPVDPAKVLRNLVQELEVQVEALKLAKDAEKLKKTMANFSAFVDELAKNLNAKSPPADFFLVARCYGSLDQHAKSAELYAKIPEPKFLERKLKKGEKLSENDERELQTYWYSQIQMAGQLRQITDKKDDNLLKAYRIVSRAQAHENARGQFLAEKEANYVLQDMGRYGTAVRNWQSFMTKLKPRLDDPPTKAMYFDAYYNMAYATYKYSQEAKVKGTPKEKFYIQRAADLIVRLEPTEGWGFLEKRFQALLESEDQLRVQYQAIKAKQK
ncbi:MAG: hypothetical protein FJ271_28815 [Planctomycetes bacterium]|nr:hypothetical protein [Planctomycetota bacterium]